MRPDAAPGGADEQLTGATALASLTKLAQLLPGAMDIMAEARAWWTDSHTEVLAAAPALCDCATPIELEDAVCDLLGGHWRRMSREHDSGFSSQEWLSGLLDAAAPHTGEPAVRRLLYGVALIAPPGLAGVALRLLRQGNKAAQQNSGQGAKEPAWLRAKPAVTASPDVELLRDAYGLRFGLLARLTGPSGQPRTYLFDLDLCHGFYEVLASGYHPNTAAAVDAWRALVGASAAEAEPAPAPADLLPYILPGGGMMDELLVHPLTEDHFRELYRGDRVVCEIADALRRVRRPIDRPRDVQQAALKLAEALTGRFRAWAEQRAVELPAADEDEYDLVAALISDWVTPGLTEELYLACSPHRIAAFTAYLNDDWLPEDRLRALSLLEPWVRYCLECGGVTGEAAEHTLAWARRAAREPEAVGADLGNHLNRPIDETTLTGPEFPLPGESVLTDDGE